jgi:hypothetical protein
MLLQAVKLKGQKSGLIFLNFPLLSSRDRQAYKEKENLKIKYNM